MWWVVLTGRVEEWRPELLGSWASLQRGAGVRLQPSHGSLLERARIPALLFVGWLVWLWHCLGLYEMACASDSWVPMLLLLLLLRIVVRWKTGAQKGVATLLSLLLPLLLLLLSWVCGWALSSRCRSVCCWGSGGLAVPAKYCHSRPFALMIQIESRHRCLREKLACWTHR